MAFTCVPQVQRQQRLFRTAIDDRLVRFGPAYAPDARGERFLIIEQDNAQEIVLTTIGNWCRADTERRVMVTFRTSPSMPSGGWWRCRWRAAAPTPKAFDLLRILIDEAPASCQGNCTGGYGRTLS